MRLRSRLPAGPEDEEVGARLAHPAAVGAEALEVGDPVPPVTQIGRLHGCRTDTSLRQTDASADWAEVRARLRSFVARRVRDEHSTHDDLVQEILLRLHRGLPRLRERERLDAFAYQVARNAISDHYRKREQPVAPEALEDHSFAEDGEDDDASGAGRAQLARCLHPVIERLDEDYRVGPCACSS
ncbi:MAG: sigma-70 family RNA polymerase sigma factor [Thermoleophilaceae bacterium]